MLVIRIKSGICLTHSRCHRRLLVEHGFYLLWIAFIVGSAPTQCPYLNYHLLTILYKLKIPYLECTLSHLHFLILQTRLVIFWNIHYWSNGSEYQIKKVFFPTVLNLLTIKKEFGDFLGPKNPTTENNTLNIAHCLQLLKKTNWDKSKNASRSILVKKKKKRYQQYGILLFTMLKTLESFLYWNPILTKTHPWSRNLRSVMPCMT